MSSITVGDFFLGINKGPIYSSVLLPPAMWNGRYGGNKQRLCKCQTKCKGQEWEIEKGWKQEWKRELKTEQKQE